MLSKVAGGIKAVKLKEALTSSKDKRKEKEKGRKRP
jgi:ethanolamine transporter EutH